MKVHLVDGTLELFRCYYGAPRAQDATGHEVGASRGFLATLLSLLRSPEVTHVAVAFDAVTDVRRPGRPSQPLTGRGTDPELRSQFPLAADLARALGLAVWPMAVRYQADDALATGARLFGQRSDVDQVVVCTTDKDLLQCVRGSRVVVLDRMRKRTLDEPSVRQRFGISPRSFPDYLALVGDPSDGLPGIPGWGPKSASSLLARYGHVEAIPASASDWDVPVRGATGLASSLARQRREAILFRDLATLRADVPLSDDVEELRWQGARRSELPGLARRIGSEELLSRVRRWVPE